jgi:hypothetical protein
MSNMIKINTMFTKEKITWKDTQVLHDTKSSDFSSIFLKYLTDNLSNFKWTEIIKICQKHNFTVKSWSKLTDVELESNNLLEIIFYYLNSNESAKFLLFLEKFLQNDTEYLINTIKSFDNEYLNFLLKSIHNKGTKLNCSQIKSLPFIFEKDSIGPKLLLSDFLLLTVPRIVHFKIEQLYQAEKKKSNGQLKSVKVNTLSDYNLLLEQEINQIKKELSKLKKLINNHIETTQNTFKIMEKRIISIIK